MQRYLLLAVLLVIAGCVDGAAEPETGPEIVASGLAVPWDLAFLPDGTLLVTERGGQLLRIGNGTQVVRTFSTAKAGEAGLLGIELHPDFAENRFVYVYLTLEDRTNEVRRYRYADGTLTDETVILDGIPGAAYHDGGRIRFGPDGFLYITVGDATVEDEAQNVESLHGTILRITDDGSIPEDNPFGNAVHSYGHRNPQGLAWHHGTLYSTEHGRSGVRSGLDEINVIEPGGNYGWPVIEGGATREGMRAPIAHSGARTTWAPASAAIVGGTLYFGGLRGEALYAAEITGDGVSEPRRVLEGHGRIRTVRVGPDGWLYVTTSNRDGRGTPSERDDLVLRIDPSSL